MTELTRHLIRQADCRHPTYDPPCYGTLPSGDRLFSCNSVGQYTAKHTIRPTALPRPRQERIKPSARHLTFAIPLYPSPQARTNCTPALMRFADLATCKAHPQANRILERAAPLQQPQTAERHCFRSTRSMSCCCELISSLR